MCELTQSAPVSAPEEHPSYLPGEVGAVVASDKQLSDLLAVAQKILGKMLSYSAIEKLYGLYDWLGMPPDLIVRLLEYCVELGKKDMRYIEKVAVSWREMGIGTVAEAERYIERQNYKRTYVYQIQKSSESRTASSRRASCAILASGIRSAYRWSWRLLLMITV